METSKVFISSLNIERSHTIPTIENSLDCNDVIIYKIYLPNFISIKDCLSNFLNSNEVSRAQRFYKEVDRNRFIIYRSILKFVLAFTTQMDVKGIYIENDFNKKPYLASHPLLHFNISHSEDHTAIAISRKKVGIDIEYKAENFDFTNILQDVFYDNEISYIENAVNKKHAFYTLWTRKEAFVKALGKGIDDDFKYMPCLDGQHDISATVLNETENWQVYSFNFAEDYSGAVCIEGLPKVPEVLKVYTLPNTMKELLELTQERKGQ